MHTRCSRSWLAAVTPTALVAAFAGYAVAAPPVNDTPAGAIVVSSTGGTFNGTILEATADIGEDPLMCGLTNSAPDVWYKWTVPAGLPTNAQIVASTCGQAAAFDTVLALFTGASWPTNLLDCNDDYSSSCPTRSRVSAPAGAAGTTFWIRVARAGGGTGATGTFTLSVTTPVPPPPPPPPPPGCL
ncbi:MAG: hypothetical protein KIT68_07360, partial [Phycisphaeraceae bacterium]|nr:hypothetical protein [Phycisphaeraceae bacterium]